MRDGSTKRTPKRPAPSKPKSVYVGPTKPTPITGERKRQLQRANLTKTRNK